MSHAVLCKSHKAKGRISGVSVDFQIADVLLQQVHAGIPDYLYVENATEPS
jgi:hypothetical protein